MLNLLESAKAFMEATLGPNWRTTLCSIVMAISMQGEDLGLPHWLVKWCTIITVILWGHFQKDKR